MKCPNCGEEPIKLSGEWRGRVSFSRYIKGYIKCVNCGSLLKRSFGKTYWVSFSIFVISFVFLYTVLKIPLGDYVSYPNEVIWGLTLVMIGSAITSSYASVLSLNFEKIDPDSLD